MELLSLSALPEFSYAGLFLFLFGSAIFIPIPEELTLLTAGYFVALGVLNPLYAVPLAICAMLLGDSLLFFLAKTGAHYAHRLHARMERIGLDKTWLLAPAHPLRAVFCLRFVTGIRLIAPLYAGFNSASWKGFLLTSLSSLIIFVSSMFLLGYAFHASFLPFVAFFEVVRHVVFAGILAIVGGGAWSRRSRACCAASAKSRKHRPA